MLLRTSSPDQNGQFKYYTVDSGYCYLYLVKEYNYFHLAILVFNWQNDFFYFRGKVETQNLQTFWHWTCMDTPTCRPTFTCSAVQASADVLNSCNTYITSFPRVELFGPVASNLVRLLLTLSHCGSVSQL